MKTHLKTIIAALLLLPFFASCGGSEGGQSTPVDSTVKNGTAPVNYSEGTPTTTIDTTIQARDARKKDTMGNRAMSQPAGNGTNTSNTSDKTTTSGSANNGDADGDRKK